MRPRQLLIGIAPLVVLVGALAPASADPLDDRMNRLAADSGCTLCHSAGPARSGDPVPPAAPTWSEIAERYRNRPNAEDKLVAIVVGGSGPGGRHWAGKTSAVEMPANRVEIGEEDARTLIRWVLR
jgi:cytochrome c551/c552